MMAQLKDTSRATRVAARSATAATVAANAASDQVRMMEAVEAPIVAMQRMDLIRTEDGQDYTAEAARFPPSNLSVGVSIANAGRSSARLIELAIDHAVCPEPPAVPAYSNVVSFNP